MRMRCRAQISISSARWDSGTLPIGLVVGMRKSSFTCLFTRELLDRYGHIVG